MSDGWENRLKMTWIQGEARPLIFSSGDIRMSFWWLILKNSLNKSVSKLWTSSARSPVCKPHVCSALSLSVTDIWSLSLPAVSLLSSHSAQSRLFLDGLISLCRDSSADQDERGRGTLFTHLLIFSSWCLPPEQSSFAHRANAKSTTKHTQTQAESKTNREVLWNI